MAERQEFCLHVGGLGATVKTSQDLRNRFSPFGTVVKVDGVAKLDVNDFQVKRCRGQPFCSNVIKIFTSRIAPARPHYVARVKRERANLPITKFVDPNKESFRVREDKAAQQLERKLAKSRARKRGTKAYESPIMELMTCKKFRVARRQWIRIDPTVYRATVKNCKTHIPGLRAMSIEKLGFIGGAKDVKRTQASRPMWECQLGEDGFIVRRLTNVGDLNQEKQLPLPSCTLQKLKDADEVLLSSGLSKSPRCALEAALLLLNLVLALNPLPVLGTTRKSQASATS
ncbi:hypothetical protein PTTG_27129 [Puccinia triticina 1-1 BBBD Race 1]|uniref:Uncharacterized protein n=1 Tax=Puccinia triticina (isolate 1-1 / race 1 (BBBD)) TaxID=630390 RepID=A0A180GNK5_PUCT1|nr:hypothetical protein PTTG_27129 [Puccinia triticina 1-1 BBBD Race 1]